MDRYNQRMSLGFILCLIQIVCSIVLLIPNMNVPGTLTVLYLSASAYGINPLMYGWASNILVRTADDAARSVTLASMSASDGLLWTFWGIVLFPADDAPYWRNGYIGMLCVSTALAGWLFVVRWVSPIVQAMCIWANGNRLNDIRLKSIPLTSMQVLHLWW
jgi:ACS family pantothenate transporter-like MFS transporter